MILIMKMVSVNNINKSNNNIVFNLFFNARVIWMKGTQHMKSVHPVTANKCTNVKVLLLTFVDRHTNLA